MLSALFLINQRGEIVIHRFYRDDVALSAANAFRLQVSATPRAATCVRVGAAGLSPLRGCVLGNVHGVHTRGGAQVIAAKEAGSAPPVRSIEGSTFMYIRHKDMFFVGVTRTNANAGARERGSRRLRR